MQLWISGYPSEASIKRGNNAIAPSPLCTSPSQLRQLFQGQCLFVDPRMRRFMDDCCTHRDKRPKIHPVLMHPQRHLSSPAEHFGFATSALRVVWSSQSRADTPFKACVIRGRCKGLRGMSGRLELIPDVILFDISFTTKDHALLNTIKLHLRCWLKPRGQILKTHSDEWVQARPYGGSRLKAANRRGLELGRVLSRTTATPKRQSR
jgi:hypothetical protein